MRGFTVYDLVTSQLQPVGISKFCNSENNGGINNAIPGMMANNLKFSSINSAEGVRQ